MGGNDLSPLLKAVSGLPKGQRVRALTQARLLGRAQETEYQGLGKPCGLQERLRALPFLLPAVEEDQRLPGTDRPWSQVKRAAWVHESFPGKYNLGRTQMFPQQLGSCVCTGWGSEDKLCLLWSPGVGS